MTTTHARQTTTTCPNCGWYAYRCPCRPCYHPRSCQACDRQGQPCGAHSAGTSGHERCSGRDPIPPASQEDTMTTQTTTIPAHQLRAGDVIVATVAERNAAEPTGFRDVTYRNTVTTDARPLGGTGLVGFGLRREGRETWEGRLSADSGVQVETPRLTSAGQAVVEAADRQEAKTAIRDMAVSVRHGAARNTLTFASLFQAERAAALFQDAGLACSWAGGNQPILQTAADFAEKEAPRPVQEMTTPALVREFADIKVWFATYEVTGRHPAGTRYHQRLKDVVNQLRERGTLD